MTTAQHALPVALRERFGALRGAADEVYLDSAATTFVPDAVLAAQEHFERELRANVHRAVHRRGRAATEAYEQARRSVAQFLGARAEEVVFTRNATEAINLVARGWAEPRVGRGDALVVTALEHHSNLVPWQQVCRRTGAELIVLPVDGEGRLVQPVELPGHTALLALPRVSNALGTIVPVAELVSAAHALNAAVLVDFAQGLAHLPLDEGSAAADFLVCSAHKAYGPMGLGVLRGRAQRLAELQPVSFGGEMVDRVTAEGASWAPVPLRFEAGTPAVGPAVAFVPALDLLEELGLAALRAHERALLEQMLDGLARLEHVTVWGPVDVEQRSGSVAFSVDGADSQVVATVLDLAGVAVRAGFHCAEPLHAALGCGPTVRASIACYTTSEDIDRLLAALPDAVAAARAAG